VLLLAGGGYFWMGFSSFKSPFFNELGKLCGIIGANPECTGWVGPHYRDRDRNIRTVIREMSPECLKFVRVILRQ
jgi:hypothetical protein